MIDNKPAATVEDGYNAIARAYHNQRDKFKNDEVLRLLISLLPPGGEVLDIGCGVGVPVVRFLVDAGFKVTGVDISSSMLELARDRVPEARFIKMDMRRLAFDSCRFDAVTAFYSLFHVPKEEHLQVLVSFNHLLRKDGILLFCSGTAAWEGFKDFHGTRMFWSHPDPEATRQMVIDAGFTVRMSEVQEHGGEKQYWVMAKKRT